MLKRIIFVLFLFVPSLTFAGIGAGKVTFLLVTHDTTPVWAVFNVETATGHACALPNATLGRFVFTVDTVKGKEMLSLLLSAEARQVPVTVQGTKTCVEQSRESVDYLYIGNPNI